MGERTDDLGYENNERSITYTTGQDRAAYDAIDRAPPLNSGGFVNDDIGDVNDVNMVEDASSIDKSNTDQDTAEIRGDIEDTRARMSSTIDAIQERLSPQNLIQGAKEATREATIGKAQEMASSVADTARETGSTLMDMVRQNPVPVALAGIGLGWLFLSARRAASERQGYNRNYWYGGNGGNRYYEPSRGAYGRPYSSYQQQPQQQNGGTGQITDRVRNTASNVSDQVQNAAGNVSDQVQNAAGNVADKAGDLANYAQGQAQRTRGWLEETWDDNPLIMTGAAVVVGALVGLSIPESQVEHQFMGETRDNLVQKAQGVAQDTVQKAQQVATDATNQMSSQQSQTNEQQTSRKKPSGSTH